MSAAAARRQGALVFLGWAAAGACLSAGLLTPFTVGPAALLAGAVLAAILAWRHWAGAACAGLLSGAGLIPVYVSYLNRDGPGQVCHTTALSQDCVSEWSPWPWLGAGLVMIVAGAAIFLAVRRANRHFPAKAASSPSANQGNGTDR